VLSGKFRRNKAEPRVCKKGNKVGCRVLEPRGWEKKVERTRLKSLSATARRKGLK